ncbi:ATP-grasp domain-containing protein [Novipirellula artificiosorum]|uniref:Ribosomal protein S6 modification protein n=1 Tax=Novipirellula artificiosorum TaxID=2528016 RepID=A0A5C6D8Y0_9BACT|nr:RimK family alpha-L-glutamate ligase [Novipirellula artificiosorum]TWU32575.1 Ribosomal protein S6 modification protein [Novipirellula artificiosorum]
MSDQVRILVLGCGDGWHANQLKMAAETLGCELHFSDYESLFACVATPPEVVGLGCDGYGSSAEMIDRFDAVLTRTMPPGSLEKVTFRLAVLHGLCAAGVPVINSPASLELAIDKFASLARVARLGYAVPETVVVQSRSEAVAAFHRLGGDCVVKPIFGGEGRGVMRIQDAQLAWYTFATLEQLDAAFYIQAFVPPGGRDTRLMVIGDDVIAARRENDLDFRTNHSQGGKTVAIEPTSEQSELARRVTQEMGLVIASVDVIDSVNGSPRVLEVNGVPGWKGLQGASHVPIATQMLQTVIESSKVREAIQ